MITRSGSRSIEPDLQILVAREDRRSGPPRLCFELRVKNPGLRVTSKRFDPIVLNIDPQAYFKQWFMDIDEIHKIHQNDVVLSRLQAKGTKLLKDLLPSALAEQLWSLRNRASTIQVQSEEPWIPWELLKFQGSRKDSLEVEPFLGEAFAICRWIEKDPEVKYLPLRNIALVVTGDSELPSAAAERDFILGLAGDGRSVFRIPARYSEVMAALASGQFDAWHFTGHGEAEGSDPNRWIIRLENGEELTPDVLSTVTRNLGETSPLIFLNGCHTGKGALSLTDMGGWAMQFLAAGAGAFIGANWAVKDTKATAFAETFYSLFISGMPLGEAARQTRLFMKERFPGDTTWLAYTIFGHPLASCMEMSAVDIGARSNRNLINLSYFIRNYLFSFAQEIALSVKITLPITLGMFLVFFGWFLFGTTGVPKGNAEVHAQDSQPGSTEVPKGNAEGHAQDGQPGSNGIPKGNAEGHARDSQPVPSTTNQHKLEAKNGLSGPVEPPSSPNESSEKVNISTGNVGMQSGNTEFTVNHEGPEPVTNSCGPNPHLTANGVSLDWYCTESRDDTSSENPTESAEIPDELDR